jgi:hypothetical protein
MRNEAVSQESAEGMETGPESDDEAIVYTSHHRELIRQAGRLAKAEQERLERESRLRRRQNGG